MSDDPVLAEPIESAPAVETAETPPEPQQKPVMVPVAVVADLREKKRNVESELENTKRELAEARALAERLTKKDGAEPPQPVQRPTQQPWNDVERAAQELVINRDIANVNQAGMAAFGGKWNDTVNALSAFGVNNPDFLVDVMEIDRANAAQILHDIAQDGEKAVALASMSKARRIAEITKMTMAQPRGDDGKFVPTKEPVKEAPKQVSKAPAPPPPVTPSASKEIDWRTDESSDDDFTKGFNEMMAKRSSGRR